MFSRKAQPLLCNFTGLAPGDTLGDIASYQALRATHVFPPSVHLFYSSALAVCSVSATCARAAGSSAVEARASGADAQHHLGLRGSVHPRKTQK